MSLHRVSVTSRKDTMVTANASASSEVIHSRPCRHVQTATDYDAQRRLQALDESTDISCDNVSAVLVHLVSQLTCSKTTRRSAAFNIVDMDELSPWSPAVGSLAVDYAQQQQSHSGKTSRPRLIAEVSTAHSAISAQCTAEIQFATTNTRFVSLYRATKK